jgi:UDP-2-acetamido-3-amino-2,3-dideoxy-glucuronate N-acetyltransferase
MESANATVAVIGCGYWGKNIVRNFAELGQLRSVCDPFPANAQAMSAQFGVPALDYAQILSDPGVKGIAIAAPAPLHADLACRAIEAGKHVMVEKPIALSLGDAQRMIDTAAAHGKLLMVGHLLNYHPAFLKVVELVKGGDIGKIRRIYSNRLSLGKLRTDEDVMWSFAPHDVSMILRLAGDRLPDRIDAHGAAYLSEGIVDFAHVHLGFDSGITAHIFTSWLHPFKEQKLVVVGEAGMIVFDDTAPMPERVTLYRHIAEIRDGQPLVKKADGEHIPFEVSEPLRNECQAFLDGIAGRVMIHTNGAEGLRVLEVLSRAEQSMKSHWGGSR